MWKANVLTTSPWVFPGPLGVSVIGRALAGLKWGLDVHNLRDFASDKSGSVDDAPYGGGGGMVLRADVVGDAVNSVFLGNGLPIIYMSPKGALLKQKVVVELASGSGVNLICGCFEGLDERVLEEYSIIEVSIGDFVLSSGDVAAMVLIDACVRMIPDVLGNPESLSEESFSAGLGGGMLLEYPHYTRPKSWRGRSVPDVLMSGHHGAVHDWRLKMAEAKTRDVRPDLWNLYLQGEKR